MQELKWAVAGKNWITFSGDTIIRRGDGPGCLLALANVPARAFRVRVISGGFLVGFATAPNGTASPAHARRHSPTRHLARAGAAPMVFEQGYMLDTSTGDAVRLFGLFH